jgi:hypothetical protein
MSFKEELIMRDKAAPLLTDCHMQPNMQLEDGRSLELQSTSDDRHSRTQNVLTLVYTARTD